MCVGAGRRTSLVGHRERRAPRPDIRSCLSGDGFAGRPTIVTMAADDPDRVLDLLGVRPGGVVELSDVSLGNANWLVDAADGRRLVLRRYHPQATGRRRRP